MASVFDSPMHSADASRAGAARGQAQPTRAGCIVTPDTILRWYRQFVAKKYDGSQRRERTQGRLAQGTRCGNRLDDASHRATSTNRFTLATAADGHALQRHYQGAPNAPVHRFRSTANRRQKHELAIAYLHGPHLGRLDAHSRQRLAATAHRSDRALPWRGFVEPIDPVLFKNTSALVSCHQRRGAKHWPQATPWTLGQRFTAPRVTKPPARALRELLGGFAARPDARCQCHQRLCIPRSCQREFAATLEERIVSQLTHIGCCKCPTLRVFYAKLT